MEILKIRNLKKTFGGIDAINDVQMEVIEGELRGLIGPNGAGKSTLFKLITGFDRPNKGEVFFEEENITGLKPYEIASKGLVRTFQANVSFGSFSVSENILLTFHVHKEKRKKNEPKVKENKLGLFDLGPKEIIDYVGLGEVKNIRSKELSHGHQRILGLGVALAAMPKVLLLDEPLSGMNEEERSKVGNLIQRINGELGVTILLVEHHVRTVMSLCKNITVLNFGKKIADGTAEEIQSDENVIKAYLGHKKEEG